MKKMKIVLMQKKNNTAQLVVRLHSFVLRQKQ